MFVAKSFMMLGFVRARGASVRRRTPCYKRVMNPYSLTHLADSTLLGNLTTLVTRDRSNTAHLLAHIAEVEKRRLFAKAAHPSMFEYCRHELHLSNDEAYKRIMAARAVRRFPAVFAAVAEGRLNLTAVVLLRPCLTQATAAELIEAATHKSKREIQVLLAERFPKRDLPTRIVALRQPTPDPVSTFVAPMQPMPTGPDGPLATPPVERVPEPVAEAQPPAQLVPEPVAADPPRPRVTPLSPARYGVQFTIDQEMHDKLEHAQALLSHQVPGADVAQVLRLALDTLIGRLEKRKFAATSQPRPRQGHDASGPRHVPAEVKRAVWKRDGALCTFVSDTGRRCAARAFLEFDHVHEVARGGEATVGGIRLRCRAHNQHTAECTFGMEFMKNKREAAQRAAAERESARARAVAEARSAAEHLHEPRSPSPPG